MRKLLALGIGVCMTACSLRTPQSPSNVLPSALGAFPEASGRHATCSASKPGSSLYVASGGSEILAIASPYNRAPKVVTTASLAGDVAFDTKKNLFVTQYNANNVVEYKPPYTGGPIAQTKLTLTGPTGIVLDGRNDLFIADSGGNRVYELAPPYTHAPKAVVSKGISNPNSLALDTHCNLFVTDQGTNTITEYAPPYSKEPPATIGSGHLSVPTGLAVWKNRLFVDNNAGNDVLIFEAPYHGSPVQTIHLPGNFPEPYGMAFDSKGHLFVGLYGEGDVVEYARPYAKPLQTTKKDLGTVEGIAIGP